MLSCFESGEKVVKIIIDLPIALHSCLTASILSLSEGVNGIKLRWDHQTEHTAVHELIIVRSSALGCISPIDWGLRWESGEVLRVIWNGTASSIVIGISSRSLKRVKRCPSFWPLFLLLLFNIFWLENHLMANSYLGLNLISEYPESVLAQHLRALLWQ